MHKRVPHSQPHVFMAARVPTPLAERVRATAEAEDRTIDSLIKRALKMYVETR